MTAKELIDKIFKDPSIKYELTEFENLKIDYNNVLPLIVKAGTGKQFGKNIYYIKSLAPFYTELNERQIYVDDGKSNPEEIVRQLWVYKLIKYYNYDKEEILLEKPITFGGDTGTKSADIVVYTSKDKTTPKIVIEVKKPKRKDGIEQLRSYLNAEGSPIGVWSNGDDKVILYRPYPKDFDALPEIPKKGQTADDIQAAKLTLAHLEKGFNFKKILLDLEELVLGSSGVNVFNEIFKIIFAKIWDEKQAIESRPDQSLEFKWFKDPELTYDRINTLFKNACDEWKGVFDENDKIKLGKEHLNVCIAPLERKRFLGSNLRIMDDAFEYLLPTEAKKKKGQFFTPRFVIDMCVRMLNPKKTEFILDPACGSAGFLVHAMEWAYPASTNDEMELRKSRFAAKYLWGIDFEEQAAKTSRALMLIAGDGHTNIFGPDVDTLEPKTWYRNVSGKLLMEGLRRNNLTVESIPSDDLLKDEDNAWKFFDELKFDVILSNPPFAGEVKVRDQLSHYTLAKKALKRAKDKQPKEERDVLFIERIIKMLKPGGRAAIVLPQGKFNNSSLAFIREWILRKARLLAVVGLHPNTFKPHTGTKTSVLFIQKYTDAEFAEMAKIQEKVRKSCPDYSAKIDELLIKYTDEVDIPEEVIPENILDLLLEEFSKPEVEPIEESDDSKEPDNDTETIQLDLEEQLQVAEEHISQLKNQLLKAKSKLASLNDAIEAEEAKLKAELEVLKADKASKDIVNEVKVEYKTKITELKELQRIEQKQVKAEIKQLEKDIPYAEYDLNLLTNKGKLQLLLDDDDLLQRLANRFVDAEVAIKLDYPIFMAVSERGGKSNNGEYVYQTNDVGNLDEDKDGNPTYSQDLLNYSISKEQLSKVDKLPDEAMSIAEAFVKFAKLNNFSFWRD